MWSRACLFAQGVNDPFRQSVYPHKYWITANMITSPTTSHLRKQKLPHFSKMPPTSALSSTLAHIIKLYRFEHNDLIVLFDWGKNECWMMRDIMTSNRCSFTFERLSVKTSCELKLVRKNWKSYLSSRADEKVPYGQQLYHFVRNGQWQTAGGWLCNRVFVQYYAIILPLCHFYRETKLFSISQQLRCFFLLFCCVVSKSVNDCFYLHSSYSVALIKVKRDRYPIDRTCVWNGPLLCNHAKLIMLL